jgi:transcriptional regulator with XRE-family HTH domain
MVGVSPLRTTNEWEVEVGRRLREIRLSRNLTQETVAVSANVSVGALKNLESGRGSSLRTLIQILRALDQVQWLESLQPPQSTFTPMALLREQQALESKRRKRGTGTLITS